MSRLLVILAAALFAAAVVRADDGSDVAASDVQRAIARVDAADASRIDALYAARAYAPAWQDTRRLAELVAELAGTRLDGLDPEDYASSRLRAALAASTPASAERRAEIDVLATSAFALALHDLSRGKVDPRRIEAHYDFAPRDAEPIALDERDRLPDVFERARPRHAIYARLREALRGLLAIEEAGGWPSIPGGPTLKPSTEDARIPALRRRLALGGYLDPAAAETPVFDQALADAVRAFQSEQYLDADGFVGKRTLAALNVPVGARIDQVRVNLERARWLLHEIQGDFVVVDLAGFKVSYFKNGDAAWSAPAQVGRPYRATPTFKSAIDAVTLNPTWTVPPTIFREDLLPRIRADRSVLARLGLRVLDARGEEMAAADVDWRRPRGVTLRQPAGPSNPLGRVAIRFPNPFGVYMHDTPHAELFGRGERAFSSGCIRVERPLELVERLLEGTSGWDRARVDRVLASGETTTIRLARPTTLLVMYWSVDTHGGARLAFKPDIYSRDARVLRELDRRSALGAAPDR